MDYVHVFVDGFVGGRIERAASGHVQEIPAGAVDVVCEIEDAFIISGGLKENCACAVAEEDGGARGLCNR